MELIERDYALQRLLDALELARQGAGRTALVYGEAGIGKTSVVQCLASAHVDGRILLGWCEALFSPRPLGPFYDMADLFSAKTQELLGREGRRMELFASLLADLKEFDGTTLIVLEDLHWADAATLDLVKYLTRRIQHARVLLVLTYRDDELNERHPLRLLFGDLPTDAAVRIPLLPLSEAAVGEMAHRTGRSSDGLFAATGGNPFFVTEALSADGLPATVRDAVLARAARQPTAVRALLDLAAIVPARVDVSMVDALLAPTREDISAALASGLLSSQGGTYAYRHELARISMEQALPHPVAAALHERVLRYLEARGGELPLARLVHHAAGAGDAAAVMQYAPRAAADAAMHGAHCDAAWLYGKALAHPERLSDEERAELLERHAYECYLTSQIDCATHACASALAIWRKLGNRRQEGHMLRWLSRMCWFVGSNADAEAYADLSVRLLETQGDETELAWALSNRSQLHMLAGHTGEAIAWGKRAIELATRHGDNEVLSHALNNVGTALTARAHREGMAMLEQSLALALEHGYGEHVARAYANLTSTAVTTRDYAAAGWFISRAGAYFCEHDLDSWSHYVMAYQARLDFEQGRWDAAAALADQLLARPDVTIVTRIPTMTVLARIRMRRGDPGADDLLEEVSEIACATGELQRLAPVAAARAEAAWLRDEDATADPIVQQTCELAERLHDPRALGELLFWCRWTHGHWHATGEIDAPYALQREGRWDAAALAWQALGCPYERAFALLEGDEAGMIEALATLSALEATASLRRCRECLYRAGVRGMARGPRASTTANPAGLTIRELQILALLTQGLSNMEIAGRIARSEKTVEHHVSAVLRKLDARTRSEAVAMAGRLGVGGVH
ncbi:ATP-binding protein [Dyella soli]|uniref:LuxR family transcriptional regulator n=1 Tax=Dyella soli TaxID=522319 RepID=A0A4R0YT01_9GAMM|nr:LuxR family transcriptional regulator [Dyella soli]TCI11195.1 LuxR family transcriptional regulator [Dyella soli]